MITALTPNMPMGSRAIRFPAVKARVPGCESKELRRSRS
ncbi:hypothetical protein STANM309S_02196 [Streptomyces tanashiensis]